MPDWPGSEGLVGAYMEDVGVRITAWGDESHRDSDWKTNALYYGLSIHVAMVAPRDCLVRCGGENH